MAGHISVGVAFIRFKYFLVRGVLFEEMGFVYLGPVDGHNIAELLETLRLAGQIEKPVLIHVITQKGRGYKNALDKAAEREPNRCHPALPPSPPPAAAAPPPALTNAAKSNPSSWEPWPAFGLSANHDIFHIFAAGL